MRTFSLSQMATGNWPRCVSSVAVQRMLCRPDADVRALCGRPTRTSKLAGDDDEPLMQAQGSCHAQQCIIVESAAPLRLQTVCLLLQDAAGDSSSTYSCL